MVGNDVFTFVLLICAADGLAVLLAAILARTPQRTDTAQRQVTTNSAREQVNGAGWLSQRAEQLGQLAIAGDDRAAPLVANQPAPLTGADLPLEPVTLGPFSHQTRHTALTASLVGLILTAVAVLGIGALIRWLLPNIPPSIIAVDSVWCMVALLIGVLGICGLFGVALLIQGVRLIFVKWALRPTRFLVDGHGIEQVKGERQHAGTMIAWPEVRAFYRVVTGTDNPRKVQMTYTVEARGRKLSWRVTARTRKAVLADHERLCRLIVTHTGLPLRDVSTALRELTLTYVSSVAGTGHGSVPSSAGFSPASLPVLPTSTRRRIWPRLAAGIPFFMVAVLIVSSMQVFVPLASYPAPTDQAQTSQSQEYSSLLRRVYAQPPLYTDVLTHDDGDWPVQKANSTDGSMGFIDGAYQLTGGPRNQTLIATSLSDVQLQGAYGDVAVEVTARQLGSSPTDGVGIVLRMSDNPLEFVAFEVSQSGTWSLRRYIDTTMDQDPWVYLIGEDSSGAVHAGEGAANHLLIVARGYEYTCYINGQYVGSYVDEHKETLLGGHAGMWVGDAVTTGRFNLFAVYPVV
jgi:hypothetical protein